MMQTYSSLEGRDTLIASMTCTTHCQRDRSAGYGPFPRTDPIDNRTVKEGFNSGIGDE